MPDEAAIKQACSNFQSFCIQQIIAAWFADAPDPQALIDEVLGKWETLLRARYAREARAKTEQTGIVTNWEEWLNDVMEDAKERIRRQLAMQMEEEEPIGPTRCSLPDHACDIDSGNCIFEPDETRSVN